MKLLIALTVITVLVALYVVWLRPRMRKTAWGAAFLDWIEPMERVLYWKSETVLWARFKQVMVSLFGLLAIIGQLPDLTPFIQFFPEEVRPFLLVIPGLALWLDNSIGVALRKDTTKPLEIVAMRTDAPEAVKAAAADAEAVTKDAVAAAVEAKVV